VGLEYLQRRLHNLPGQLFQCSITLRVKNFFLMFRQSSDSEKGCQKSAAINSASLCHFSHVLVEESDGLLAVLLGCFGNLLLPQLGQAAPLPHQGLLHEECHFLRKFIFRNLLDFFLTSHRLILPANI